MKFDINKPFASFKDETLFKFVEVLRHGDMSENKQLMALGKKVDGRVDAWTGLELEGYLLDELAERLKKTKK